MSDLGVVVAAIAFGALILAGVNRATFYRWMEQGAKDESGPFRDFRDSIVRARARACCAGGSAPDGVRARRAPLHTSQVGCARRK